MMELVCPAGTPAALRAAVEAGAHSVYCGFADETIGAGGLLLGALAPTAVAAAAFLLL